MTNTQEYKEWQKELKEHEAEERRSYRELRKYNAKIKRDHLVQVAREIRQYLKETGGTFSVRTQTNNVIWISGAYSFGVHHTKRAESEAKFNGWLIDKSAEWNLECHIGLVHKYLK